MILEPAWKLFAAHSSVYIHTVCYNHTIHTAESTSYAISAFEDDEPGIEGMTQELVDLITTLVGTSATHPLIRTGLLQFVTTLCAYLLIPRHELTLYQCDPLYFMEASQQRQDELDMEGVRLSCTQVLETLTENFGQVVTEIAFSTALSYMVPEKKVKPSMNYLHKPAAKKEAAEVDTSYNGHEEWRRNELGMYLLSILADDLYVALEKGVKFVDVEKVVTAMQGIMKKSTLYSNPILLGRFLATCAELNQIIQKSNPFCLQVIEVVLGVFKTKYAESVMLIACKCLVRYANLLQMLPAKTWDRVVNEIFKLQSKGNSYSWHIATETIATLYQYGSPKQLSPLLPGILHTYLSLSMQFEEQMNDTLTFIQRLFSHSAYIIPIIAVYAPFMARVLEAYPKDLSQPLFKVWAN